MDFFSLSSLSYKVIEYILEHPNTNIKDIQQHIKKSDNTQYSVPSIYKIIHELKHHNIIFQTKHTISIRNLIVLDLLEKLKKHTYLKYEQIVSSVTATSDATVTHYFNNLESCDTYWADIFTTLVMHEQTKKEPVYIWNPHEWFIIFNTKQEDHVMDIINNTNRLIYFLIGSNTSLDKEFKSKKSNVIQIYNNEKEFFRNNLYINIFSDIIIKVYLPKLLAEELDYIYTNNITDPAYLNDVYTKEYNIRFTITQNKQEATKIKKVFKTLFY